MSKNQPGRLAYWQAKADLSYKLFYEQVKDPNKQDQAVKNLARYIHANREIAILNAGQDMSWLIPTEGEMK
jgi:hypothetical protein